MKKPAPRPLLWPAFYATELEAIGPNLNFIRRDELNDIRPNYSKQGLEEIAGHLTGAGLADALAATVLRQLANNSDALDAMNHKQDTVDGGFLGLNRAVHYHVLRELQTPSDRKKLAMLTVATVWRVADSQVKDDYTKFKTAAAKLVDGIVKEAMATVHYPTREAVLDALAEDMTHRAALVIPKRRRQKSTKKVGG